MNKKYLHHLWTRIRPIKVQYLVMALIIGTIVSALALRSNNLGMVKLREQVYQADKDNGDVEGALQQLRAYVYTHMNTELSSGTGAVYPPIQLKYSYQRLQRAEKQRVQTENNSIYTNAQNYCEQQNPTDFSGRNRVPCIEKYVSEHGVKERSIPDALYKFDFVSPRWSPDFAGFSVLISLLILVVLILRVVAGWLARRLL